MRDNLESSPFETMPTQVPGLDSGLLWVPEKLIQEDTPQAPGTKLKDFLPQANKGDALDRGYGDYVLSLAQPAQQGWRPFWFAKERSPEEIAVAFRTKPGLTMGMYWPPVISTPVAAYLMAYDENGDSYVDQIVWDFAYADKAYRGPTKIVEEYFASHAPITFSLPDRMQEQGDFFDYGLGSVTIPPSLHGSFTLEVVIPESSRRPTQTFTKIISATTPATRPDEVVIDIDDNFDAGIFIAKKVTAYKP